MSLVAKNIDALSKDIKCNKIIFGKTIKGTTRVTKSILDMTVVRSETGNDLQNIKVLSFLSSAKVLKLKARIAKATVNKIGNARTTKPDLMTAVICSRSAVAIHSRACSFS